MYIILGVAALIGCVAALWFFWDKIAPRLRRIPPPSPAASTGVSAHDRALIGRWHAERGPGAIEDPTQHVAAERVCPERVRPVAARVPDRRGEAVGEVERAEAVRRQHWRQQRDDLHDPIGFPMDPP